MWTRVRSSLVVAATWFITLKLRRFCGADCGKGPRRRSEGVVTLVTRIAVSARRWRRCSSAWSTQCLRRARAPPGPKLEGEEVPRQVHDEARDRPRGTDRPPPVAMIGDRARHRGLAQRVGSGYTAMSQRLHRGQRTSAARRSPCPRRSAWPSVRRTRRCRIRCVQEAPGAAYRRSRTAPPRYG